jgi:hypothetical protein
MQMSPPGQPELLLQLTAGTRCTWPATQWPAQKFSLQSAAAVQKSPGLLRVTGCAMQVLRPEEIKEPWTSMSTSLQVKGSSGVVRAASAGAADAEQSELVPQTWAQTE